MNALQFWTQLLMVTASSISTLCLFRGFRNAYRDIGPWGVVRELTVFVLFAVTMWFVESWALTKAPFYAYSSAFTDKLHRLDVSALATSLPKTNTVPGCTQQLEPLKDYIPLSVILLEASLIYAAMWTARRMTKNLAVQPLIGGLALLSIDLFLDPIVATVKDCKGNVIHEANGIGLWEWYVPTEADFCEAGQHCTGLVAKFLSIPIFNFAAWLAAPIMVISLVNIAPFLRDWIAPTLEPRIPILKHLRREVPLPAKGTWGWGLLIAIIATAALFGAAPLANNQPMMQYAVFGAGLAVVVLFVLLELRKLDRTKALDLLLVIPALAALATALLGGTFEHRFVQQPWILPLAFACVWVAVWLHLLPSNAALRRVSAQWIAFDKLVRFHYFGFPTLLILLGASLVPTDPSAPQGPGTFELSYPRMTGLLTIALAFQIFAYLTNDVVDFDVDKTNGFRQSDPLVTKRIAKDTTLALGLVAVPVAAIVLFGLIGTKTTMLCLAIGTLVTAVLLMSIYNLWGKKFVFTPLTDLLQGVSWGLLALLGALATGTSLDQLATAAPRLLALGAYGALYIMLISGVHGGLRDLVNDKRHQQRTTPLLLGAEPASQAEGEVISNWRVLAYAYLIHTLIFVVVGLFVTLEVTSGASTVALYGSAEPIVVEDKTALGVGLGVCFLIASSLLYQVVRPTPPRIATRRDWLGLHALFLLTPPLLVFYSAQAPALVFKVFVVVYIVAPIALWQLAMRALRAPTTKRALSEPKPEPSPSYSATTPAILPTFHADDERISSV